jgi:hypothetical protein
VNTIADPHNWWKGLLQHCEQQRASCPRTDSKQMVQVVRPINLLDLHFDGQCLGPSREIRAAIVAHAHPESLTDVQLRLQSEDVWRRYTSARMIPHISWGLG